MAKRISSSTLNATTLDILNVIRQNASYDYQQNVPVADKASDIPKVGEVIYGTPAFSNQFINALVNRIAIVRVQSATFNNPYSILKKGYLEFGETVEDIFVSIAKAVDYTPEKASEREFKRTLPDIRSAFHTMNWRVMYPVTIQDEDLRQAFLSVDGVTDLIAKIVDTVYTAAEYDEFLLFKYLLIKAISHGKMKPTAIESDTDLTSSAVAFRSASNILPFMSSEYNEAKVKTNTPKSRQIIFMDAKFNAQYDVNVLASAFNMDKADFMGRLFLIDNWTDFDNERFDIIRANSDGIEEITSAELTLLNNVKAVLVDENWFQVYDNNNKFTEQYVASGLYWNYFYHVWKTVSSSPFANAIVFVAKTADIELPASLTCECINKDISDEAIVLAFNADTDEPKLNPNSVHFVQTQALTSKGIAVQKYGVVIIPKKALEEEITIVAEIEGTEYTVKKTPSGINVGDTLTFTSNEQV
jgi:hypothetical protein